MAFICRFKKTEDCMVDQVESEPFSTAETHRETQSWIPTGPMSHFR